VASCSTVQKTSLLGLWNMLRMVLESYTAAAAALA
jgi:hypothetical protein